ncbi:hypothetical protein SEA_AMGINE_78 [Mycobacterium phage Amgine]|uniref:Uncharacterized protein n=1 Tax=Mycobacterium phage Amgine TaxID=2015817 RepID=A0A222ZMH3_9CAUD|nr:hypothetical protein I5G84_gp78 [Mycobacterium phage Amgine]ASR85678.1 hypothetical protein SEA_AMGINE_78 [Mycobacterium phage Amgine]
MMDHKMAEQIGREAFAAGKGNFPLADARIVDAMYGAMPGQRTYLMQAFNRGWTAANLAAPVG